MTAAAAAALEAAAEAGDDAQVTLTLTLTLIRCALAAPLMLGNDPRKMSVATRRILMAPELLALNQDPLGKQARRVWQEGPLAIWRKELASGEVSHLGVLPSMLTTHYSPLTAHCSLLTTHCSLLTTHHSLGAAHILT